MFETASEERAWDKVSELEDKIAELEKENKKLNRQLSDIAEAKEIIKYLLNFINKEGYRTRWDINIKGAEDFIKE